MRYLLPLIAVAVAAGPALPAQSVSSPAGETWRAVYKHDPSGRPLAGHKRDLIEAVRRGLSVRLAWGVRHPRDSTRSVEHTALPVFLTVVDETEVFVQVAEHLAYADYWSRDAQAIRDPRITWSAILGTTGTFNALFYSRASGELVRELPQRVTITWFVEGAGGTGAPPLFSNDPVLPPA
jgi:hypothetical protein